MRSNTSLAALMSLCLATAPCLCVGTARASSYVFRPGKISVRTDIPSQGGRRSTTYRVYRPGNRGKTPSVTGRSAMAGGRYQSPRKEVRHPASGEVTRRATMVSSRGYSAIEIRRYGGDPIASSVRARTYGVQSYSRSPYDDRRYPYVIDRYGPGRRRYFRRRFYGPYRPAGGFYNPGPSLFRPWATSREKKPDVVLTIAHH